jgi:hypothetical protein
LFDLIAGKFIASIHWGICLFWEEFLNFVTNFLQLKKISLTQTSHYNSLGWQSSKKEAVEKSHHLNQHKELKEF